MIVVDTAPAPAPTDAIEVGWDEDVELVKVVHLTAGDVWSWEYRGLGGPCAVCGQERGTSEDASLSHYCLPCLYGWEVLPITADPA